MIKKFFLSFLSSMAAIWLSLLLMVIVAFTAIIGIAFSGDSEWQGATAIKVTDNSILEIDLTGSITERKEAPDFSAIIANNEINSVNLSQTISTIYRAAHDSRISGIYLKCGGCMGGTASLQELSEALTYFKSKPSKWILAYGDNYLQTDYIVASNATEIWLNPIGTLDIHGLSATTMFYKGLLDKLGVKMQVLRVGTFKSAIEPFILKEMSPASRLQQESYMGSIWKNVSETIAQNRAISTEQVNQIANQVSITMPADSMLSNGLVNKIGYRHEIEARIAELCKKDNFSDVQSITPAQYSTTFNATDFSYLPDVNNKDAKTIAILYATGEISDNGQEGIIGNDMIEEITKLTDDAENLAGLILRVNSPGGSAFASEQIWNALEQFKQKTGLPLYVSMGDVAASGGYYISCGADVIYAEPTTITGSIGIFGMIPEIKELLNKHLGVTTSTVCTNSNGNFPTLTEPMTPNQTKQMQAYIERGYDLFTKRCANGRNMTQDAIKAIAEGRVWSGTQALENGLVDRLGSLRSAIYGLAADKNLTSYQVKEYPEIKPSPLDLIMEINELDLNNGTIEQNAPLLMKRIEEFTGEPTIQCRMEDIVIQ